MGCQRAVGIWVKGLVAISAMLVASAAFAQLPQIVINEIVDDIRAADSSEADDDREFIELYNAGDTAVNIGNWTLNYWLLGNASGSYFLTSDAIPPDTMIAPGDYYVIGSPGVPNVDLPISASNLFPEQNTVFELRDGPQATGNLIDAVAVETFRFNELANLRPEHGAQVGGGVWGQLISPNLAEGSLNMIGSLARFTDGRDTNVNGRDFGYLPITPGESNALPQNPRHTVPNVDSLGIGDQASDQYYASFILPRVIDPTVQNAFNPNPIPRSPQGGNALIAYDETGGGNVAYSKELVNGFQISAYISTEPFNIANNGQGTPAAPGRIQNESTTYGIGSSDPFFATPDASGLSGVASSANGNTGIGWHIERVERFGDADFDQDSVVDGADFLTWQRNYATASPNGTNDIGDANGNQTVDAADLNYWRVLAGATGAGEIRQTKTVLMLVDFNDGGDGVPADQDWTVIASYDLSAAESDWHTLGIDYDPATGDVVATFDDQTINYNTETGLAGTFYVGYREGLPGAGNGPARPPTFDILPPAAGVAAVPEPASIGLTLIGAMALLMGGRARRAERIA